MKTATITCHDVYNYGASLQAFALQSFQIANGIDNLIIDYKPPYLASKYKFSWYVNDKSPQYKRCHQNVFFRLAYVIRRFLMEYRTIGRKLAFDNFTKKHLSLTSKYESYSNLCKNPPEADAYIVGSDQVWNNNPLNNGWDPAFFLQFGSNQTKKISYAASFGSTIECPDLMKNWISSLDEVSIREKSSLFLLENFKNAEVVSDPVFLLSSDEWRERLALKPTDKKYILIYDLSGNNSAMMNQAKKLAAELNLDIYNIVVSKKRQGVKNLKNLNPKDFVEYISNAEYVFSDSFHATAFSLIFKKKFFTYQFKNLKASRRMTDVLDKTGCINRFDCKNVIELAGTELSQNIQSLIYDYSQTSKSWLLKALNI